MEKCFPSVASAWEGEAKLYQASRFTCDRLFGNETPSAWTENLEDEDIFQRLQQGNQCRTDQSVFGQPLRPVSCKQAAKEFTLSSNIFDGNDICFIAETKKDDIRRKTTTITTELMVLGEREPGTDNLYRLSIKTGVNQGKLRYAIKQSERSYLTNRPQTCEEVCTQGIGKSAPGQSFNFGTKDAKTEYFFYEKKGQHG